MIGMIAANAPLDEILKSLVLLIEAQASGCSAQCYCSATTATTFGTAQRRVFRRLREGDRRSSDWTEAWLVRDGDVPGRACDCQRHS